MDRELRLTKLNVEAGLYDYIAREFARVEPGRGEWRVGAGPIDPDPCLDRDALDARLLAQYLRQDC